MIVRSATQLQIGHFEYTGLALLSPANGLPAVALLRCAESAATTFAPARRGDGWLNASSDGLLWDRAIFSNFFALLASLRDLQSVWSVGLIAQLVRAYG